MRWDNLGSMLRDVRSHARLSGDVIVSADVQLTRTIGFQALRGGSETRSWEIGVSHVKTTLLSIESADPELWAWMGGNGICTAKGRIDFADKCSLSFCKVETRFERLLKGDL